MTTNKKKMITYSGMASHLAHGNDARHVVVPIAIAIVALVSWATRPRLRTLEAS